MSLKRFILAAGFTAAALPAFAHTGGTSSGFVSGMLHPVGGVDHVLAMVAVGLFAALLGGRALWAVPASFLVMMLVGGALGFAGIAVPAVEAGILASIIVLGSVITLGQSWPVGAAMALVGVFAIFHGYAHGAEMPLEASAISYSLGFALMTAFVHGLGIVSGRAFLGSGQLIRFAGAAVAAAGLMFAVA